MPITANCTPPIVTTGPWSRSRMPSRSAATAPSTTTGSCPSWVSIQRPIAERAVDRVDQARSPWRARRSRSVSSCTVAPHLGVERAHRRRRVHGPDAPHHRRRLTRAGATPAPNTSLPARTTSRSVPSSSICASTSARLDAEMPNTETIAAMPIAMPSAVRAARPLRPRKPYVPTETKSPAAHRERQRLRFARSVRRAAVHHATCSSTRPSRMLTRRGNRAARSRSWVTTMIVDPAAMQLEQQLDDRRRRRRVEVSGRLVGEHERRFTDDRTRDRDSLTFAARHLRWSVVQSMAEPDVLQCLNRAAPGARAADSRGTRSPEATLSTASAPSSRWNCWNTKPSRAARRPAERGIRSSTSRPGPPRASAPTSAGRACRSRSAGSTCPIPTARRRQPTHRRRRAATRPPAHARAATLGTSSRHRPVPAPHVRAMRPTPDFGHRRSASVPKARARRSFRRPAPSRRRSTAPLTLCPAVEDLADIDADEVTARRAVDDLDRIAALGERQQRTDRHDRHVRRQAWRRR